MYNHVLALNLGGLDYFLALKTPTKNNNLEIFLFVSIEMNLFYGLENKTEGITMIMHFFFFTLLDLKNKILTIKLTFSVSMK